MGVAACFMYTSPSNHSMSGKGRIGGIILVLCSPLISYSYELFMLAYDRPGTASGNISGATSEMFNQLIKRFTVNKMPTDTNHI